MSLQDFRARLHHEQFQFAETLAFVAEHYDYQPSAFRNGAVESAAGQNEGSCKTLGLALLEAMTLGMPVLALSTTEAPHAVPPEAGLLSNDPDELLARARDWLHDRDAAAAAGAAARDHALRHYGLGRFLADWDTVLQEVTT